MTPPAPPIPITVLIALALGVGMLAFTTFLACRRGAGAGSFGWAVIGGLSFSLLGMAAALRQSQSLGLAAALAQLLCLALAVLLGVLCGAPAGSAESRGGRFGPAGRFLAWLTLIGLPPTPGFHAKVLLYRALLTVGWPWVMALAIGTSWLLLVPALRDARSLRPGAARRLRTAAVALLILLVVALSLFPYLWLPVGGPPPAPPDAG